MAKESLKNPFQVIDALFEIDPTKGRYGEYDHTHSQYKKVSDKEKQRNFFIVNRRLAIKYPVQACRLSFNGINPMYAVDCWYAITKKLAVAHKRKPQWLWLKLAKAKKEKELKITNRAKEFYMDANGISEKEFNLALKYEPIKMQDYLKQVENYLKQLEKSNKNG
jgi:hypothetical protein